MARRKTKDPEFSLFPFLSVLMAVMGVLVLVIAGTAQIGFARPKQRIDVERFREGEKSPIYVECRKDGVVIHGDDPTRGPGTFVPRSDIGKAGGRWETFRSRAEVDPNHYVLFLVRAEGVGAFTEARASLSRANVQMGHEPLFGAGDVRFRGVAL